MKKKTQREKREKLPFISEENKMDPEMISQFENYKGDPKPVIEMIEDEIMPLNIFIAKFISNIKESEDIDLNLMLTILHLKKENKLEIRGRMRYEDTGRKTIFTLPESFKLEELDKAKAIVFEFYTGIVKELPFIPVEKPYEIDFEVNEKANKVIKKLNDSNQFNFGTIDKKKK